MNKCFTLTHWGLWYTAKQGLSDHHHAEIQSLSSTFLLLLQPFYNFVSKLCLQLFKLDPIFIYQIHFLVEVEGLERTVCLSGHATSGANRLPQTNTKQLKKKRTTNNINNNNTQQLQITICISFTSNSRHELCCYLLLHIVPKSSTRWLW